MPAPEVSSESFAPDSERPVATSEVVHKAPRRQVDRLVSKGLSKKKPGRYLDGNGLFLQVSDTGASSWVLRVKIRRGKRREIGLGSFPLVTLAEAREKAKELRKVARAGGDPIAIRDKAMKQPPLFRDAVETVHKLNEQGWKNRKHASQWINTLKIYVVPTLGDISVDAIRSEHIVQAVSDIWSTKPETARRVLQRIRTVLLWAKGNGYRSDSPTDEVQAARNALPRHTRVRRHHKALPYPAVPAFIRELHTFSAAETVRVAFEFLILTATRSNEVLNAKWSEIDLDQRIWTIPPQRMKAKREHLVPLSKRCTELLEQAARLSGGCEGYIFHGARAGRPLSNMAFLMVLRRMEKDFTAHGFRSSFRNWCAECTTFISEVAEAALAHTVKDQTVAAYMRTNFFEPAP